MTKVIELVTVDLYLFPTFATRPMMWMFRVHCAACIKISVRFLCFSYYLKHTVNIRFKACIGV